MKTLIIILATALCSFGLSYYIFNRHAKETQAEIYYSMSEVDEPYLNIIEYMSNINRDIMDTLYCSNKLTDTDKNDITNIQIKTKWIQKFLSNTIHEYHNDRKTGKFNREKENNYWLGKNHEIGEGKAYKIKNMLNEYFDGLRYNDGKKENIAYIQTETAFYRPKNKGNISWEQQYFSDNWYSINCHLHKLLIDVLVVQKNELSYYAKKANIEIREMEINQRQIICRVKEMEFDVNLAVFPYNPILPLGAKYKSDIKLMAVSKEVLKYNTNLGEVKYDQLEIPIYQHTSPQKKEEHTYTLDTKLQGKPLSNHYSFTTYIPSIAMQTETSQQLYLDCRHELHIEANDLEAYKRYAPIFNLNNAYILQQKNNHNITICPTKEEVYLDIFNPLDSMKVYLGRLNYKAVKPPKPDIQLSIDHQAFNPLQNQAHSNSSFQIQIIPNKIFQAQMPQDSHYQIGTIEIYQKSNQNLLPKFIQSFPINKNIAHFQLPKSLFKQNKREDIILVVKDVYRINFKGEKIKEDYFSPQENMFTLGVTGI